MGRAGSDCARGTAACTAAVARLIASFVNSARESCATNERAANGAVQTRKRKIMRCAVNVNVRDDVESPLQLTTQITGRTPIPKGLRHLVQGRDAHSHPHFHTPHSAPHSANPKE